MALSSSTTTTPNNDEIFWVPLYMSCIAGASTCLGAAIVFCQQKQSTNKMVVVSRHVLAFSLALAASVMLTVSLISILPECLRNETTPTTTNNYVMVDLTSRAFFERFFFFIVGCLFYVGLSQCSCLPDPNHFFIEKEAITTESNNIISTPTTIHKKKHTSSLCWNTGNNNNNNNNKQSDNEEEEEINNNNDDGDEEDPPIKQQTNDKNNDGNQQQQQLLMLNHHQRNVRSRRVATGTTESHHDDDTPTKTRLKSKSSSSSLWICWNQWWQTFSIWTSGHDLQTAQEKRAWRVALLLFVSLLVHNFPEGLAVAASALESYKLGWTVMIGILIHNIPEGIAIAIPCLAARPNAPWLAFGMASLSGLAEPCGALVALLVLPRRRQQQQNEDWMPNVLALVAGIMIAVALIELYPEAMQHVRLVVNKNNNKNQHNEEEEEEHEPIIKKTMEKNEEHTSVEHDNNDDDDDLDHFGYQCCGGRFQINASILGGTVLGIVIMVVTECYLPA